MTILCIIGLAWSTLGIALAFLSPGNPRSARYSFTLVMVVFSWPLAMTLVSISPMAADASALILLHVHAVPFLFGPALYLYARSIMRLQPKGLWPISVHAIPFITLNIIELALPGLFSPRQGLPADAGLSSPIAILALGLSNAASVVAYGLATYRLILRYRRDAGDFYSSGHGKYTLRWLGNLTKAYLAAFGASITFLAILPFLPGFPFFYPEIAINASIGFFLFFFVLFAHNQGFLAVYDEKGTPTVPKDAAIQPTHGRETSSGAIVAESKYSRSTLGQDAVELLFSQMESFMYEQKPWLKPELDLDDLSRSLGYSRHEVSQTINSLTNGNFYSYVNRFRVEAFLRAIGEGQHGRYSFVTIALECGFNSQSAFYSAVKKQTGKTPKELVRSLPPLSNAKA